MLKKAYATGSCKTASARVFISEGNHNFQIKLASGKIVHPKQFSQHSFSEETIFAPLKLIDVLDSIQVFCTVKGSGFNAQARAIKHGLSKALSEMFPDKRSQFASLGFLTRDPRSKESKKIGHHSARVPHQRAKR